MVDIKSELEKKILESNQRATTLSDRLNQLDQFNQGTAVPQISSQGPKGYNPMNSMQALFNMISGRKTALQDVESERTVGTNLISELADYEKANKPEVEDPLDKLTKTLQAKKLAKELGLDIDFETGEVKSTETEISPEKKQIIADIDEVLGRDTKSITGLLRMGGVLPGAEGVTTKAKVEQIKSKLSLEQREKLKGTGTISDFEAKMLGDAVAALNYKMSDEDFKAELYKIRGILSGEQAEPQPQSNTESSPATGLYSGLQNLYKQEIELEKTDTSLQTGLRAGFPLLNIFDPGIAGRKGFNPTGAQAGGEVVSTLMLLDWLKGGGLKKATDIVKKVTHPMKSVGELRQSAVAEVEGKTISGSKIIKALEKGRGGISPTQIKQYDSFLEQSKPLLKGDITIGRAVELNQQANQAFAKSGTVKAGAANAFNKIMGSAIKSELKNIAPNVSSANKLFELLYKGKKVSGTVGRLAGTALLFKLMSRMGL